MSSISRLHGTYDSTSGLTYNAHTRKWVKRLRPSTKGQAIGQAKGQVYARKAKELHLGEYIAWLPMGLSQEQLTFIFDSGWTQTKDWEMDKVLATLNTYYIHRYHYGLKQQHLSADGFLYLSNKCFRQWVHDTDYIYYLEVLQTAQILEVKEYRPNAFDAHKTLKCYRINPALLQGEQQWYASTYTTDFMRLKCYNWKQRRKKLQGVNATRRQLAAWAEVLVKNFDYERLYTDLTLKVQRSRKANPWQEAQIKKRSLSDILRIAEGLVRGEVFWCNAKDKFGFRFHSPFTSINSFLLSYLMIEGQPATEVDLCNSQMFFFSLLLEDFDIVYPLLRDGDSGHQFQAAIRFIEREREQVDLQLFKAWAQAGILYEEVAQHFNRSRKWAKRTLFRVLFGNDQQCLKAKAHLAALFPTLVKLSNILNEHKLIPMMLQRLEATLMIDTVSAALIQEGCSPFATCHDSIICQVSEVARVKEMIVRVFQELGLPVPKFKDKTD